MVLLQRKLCFSKDPEGGGGVEVKMLIYLETHITCDFPRGIWTSYPPLDPHMVLVHVHPRTLVLYIQGTRLLSTVLVQPRIRLLN